MQRFVVGIAGDWSPAPSHPLSQGQITFLLETTQNEIVSLDYEMGFNHRGDEKVLQARDFRQGLSLINRPGWQVPIAFELGYAQACEDLMGLKIPNRTAAIRDLVLQIQIWIGTLRFWIAIEQSLDSSVKSRLDQLQRATELHERLTGGRIHDSFIRLGGVGADLLPQDTSAVRTFWAAQPPIEFDFKNITTANQNRLEKLNRTSDAILSAADLVDSTPGEYAVQLPKVVKVPRGNSFQSVPGLGAPAAVWLHSDGGKSPAAIKLIPASLQWLLNIQECAIGLDLAEFKELLICTPLGIGDLER